MSDGRIKIFYSYSHKDERLRNKLEIHLKILKRKGLIEEWHDRKIKPGDVGESEIDSHIETADIVLLLISADFIASDYCYNKELRKALAKHKSGEAKVIPIILRPIEWHDAPFGKLQALPRDGKPVMTWKNKDEAWLDVIKGIQRTITQIVSSRSVHLQNGAHVGQVPKAITHGTNRTHFQDSTSVGLQKLLKEEFERIDGYFGKKQVISGFSTGFYNLDEIIDGIHKKDIIVIAGRPSMGKTDFAQAIATIAAAQHMLSVLFFSTRLAAEHINRRILSCESEIPITRIMRGHLTKGEMPVLAQVGGKLSDVSITINDESPLTDQQIEEEVKQVGQ